MSLRGRRWLTSEDWSVQGWIRKSNEGRGGKGGKDVPARPEFIATVAGQIIPMTGLFLSSTRIIRPRRVRQYRLCSSLRQPNQALSSDTLSTSPGNHTVLTSKSSMLIIALSGGLTSCASLILFTSSLSSSSGSGSVDGSISPRQSCGLRIAVRNRIGWTESYMALQRVGRKW